MDTTIVKEGEVAFAVPGAELNNLIDHLKLRERGFFLLGQSWGGMFGGAYASLRQKGLKKIVLSGAPGSIPLLAQSSRNLLAALPEKTRKTLEECGRKGDHTSPEFEQASKIFYSRCACRLDPYPKDVIAAFNNLADDPTSYLTMTFKDWEGWKEGHKIEVETLLLNGQYNEATDVCVRPWFSSIPKVRWVTIENASHMCHWEQRQRYIQLVGNFLSPIL
ncbi:Alpha/Beta hydrolase protein [Xylariaceae sp. FL1651]|nr:Alpha/Beta hydrolase protein [Xylariaceae sp. FL1651]